MTRIFPVAVKRSAVAVRLAKSFYDLRNRKLEKVIFTATTGRSGTDSLSEVFKSVPSCHAVHEPYPVMNDEWLRSATFDDIDLTDQFYRKVKSIYIRRSALGARYYFESNHQFIKTFIAPAIRDFGSRLEVVHLVRPALQVATSIYRLRDWPGTEIGNAWWLDYRAPTNRIRISSLLESDREFSHPFYRALWYWYETEARITYWRLIFPKTKFHYFETNWINDLTRVSNLMESLGIKCELNKLSAIVGVRKNDIVKRNGKKFFDLAVAEVMHERFRALLEEKGYLASVHSESSLRDDVGIAGCP